MGWDRTAPAAAAIDRLGIIDAAVDGPLADVAARIAADTGVSVADAHVGAVVRALDESADDGVALTSDPQDISRAASPVRVRVVRIRHLPLGHLLPQLREGAAGGPSRVKIRPCPCAKVERAGEARLRSRPARSHGHIRMPHCGQ